MGISSLNLFIKSTDIPASSGVQGPGDIIYTPIDVPHHCVNLTNCLAVTHNYKRSAGHTFLQRGVHLVSKLFNREVPGTIDYGEEDK